MPAHAFSVFTIRKGIRPLNTSASEPIWMAVGGYSPKYHVVMNSFRLCVRIFMMRMHRRTSRGAVGLQPPDSVKTIIFRAKAKFFGQKPAAKNEEKNIFVFIKRKKTEFILSSEIKCPKSGIFTNNYWVGESGKVLLQVSIAVFFGRRQKNFRAKMAQPP